MNEKSRGCEIRVPTISVTFKGKNRLPWLLSFEELCDRFWSQASTVCVYLALKVGDRVRSKALLNVIFLDVRCLQTPEGRLEINRKNPDLVVLMGFSAGRDGAYLDSLPCSFS